MQMGINRSSPDYTKCIDVSSLPVTDVDKTSRGGGCFLIPFSLLWGGFPAIAMFSLVRTDKFEPTMLIPLVFATVGIAMFIAGLRMVTSSTTTVIDGQTISVMKKSLFGTRQWSERLSAYDGILSRSEYHSGGKNRPSYTLYIVEMRHPDRKKTVKLYESKSDVVFRVTWEDYCRRLNLPALEMDGGKLVKRDPADLDKSVRDLVKEGKVKVEFDPSRPPPGELELRVDGDVLELTVVRKKAASLFWMLVLLAIPGVMIYFGFFTKSDLKGLGVVGSILFAIFLAASVWSLVTRRQIRIGKDLVEARVLTPWGVSDEESISTSDIEAVRIGAQEGRGRNAVLIEADSGVLEVGAGLSSKALEWLKNCILRVVSA